MVPVLGLLAAYLQPCAFLSEVDIAFWDPERSGYVDYIEGDKRSGQLAFNWGVGVMLTALTPAAKEDPKWAERLRAYLRTVTTYWNEEGPVPGFDVLPAPKPVDRYYDDNAWMVMALIEAAEALNEPQWNTWAERSLRYVLSGEDDKLGGGIYWKETEKASKNTCSNGPAAAACLAMYRVNRNPEYLERARRLYAWTKSRLQDPEDGLYWDNIALDGRIEKTKWSYNTALMLRSAVELHELTGEPEYLADAKRMASAAVARWIRTDGKVACEGRFAHLLLENLLRYEAATGERVFDSAAVTAQLKALKADGWLGKRWDQPGSGDRVELIDQASGVRALFILRR